MTASNCAGLRRPSRSNCAAMPRWRRPTYSGSKASSAHPIRSGLARSAAYWNASGGTIASISIFLQPLRNSRSWRQSLLLRSGVQPVWQGQSRFDAVVLVGSESIVRDLRPDLTTLESLPYRGIIVSSRSEHDEFDFVSRFFAPAVGIDEDPVTGSAHCCLAPLWADRLGKHTMNAYQASARGGVVHLRISGDRVILGGHAVSVFKGELCAKPGAT